MVGKPSALLQPDKITLLFIGIAMIWISSNLNWGSKNWMGILEADARGYYGFLPATFIYHDLNFNYLREIEGGKYYNPHFFYDYRTQYEGKTINKYYIGTALAELPFFLAAHCLTLLTGGEADGYSRLYPVMMSIAALFYMLAGLWCLNKLLSLYELNSKVRSLILITGLFGTNLFYYTVGEPGMSHVFSFAFISCFLLLAKKWLFMPKPGTLVFLSFLFSFIVLIRPVNGLIVFFLPFIAGSFQKLKIAIHLSFQLKSAILLSLLVGLTALFLQLLVYKVSTGNFLIYAYGSEGFNFLNPRLLEFLFSYKKGAFLYTPVFLLSLSGLFILFKQKKFLGWSFAAFILFLFYVLSSWYMWFYGGGFSARPLVEFIPVFMLCLGFALSGLSHIPKRILQFSSIVLILLCQIQTFQYRYHQIHWSEMTKEKYWSVFLRLDRIL